MTWRECGSDRFLHRQVELILVSFPIAAVFGAAVGENPQQRHVVLLIKRQHAIVEHIGRHKGVLAIVQLSEGDLSVDVDKRLLVNATPVRGERIMQGFVPATPIGTTEEPDSNLFTETASEGGSTT